MMNIHIITSTLLIMTAFHAEGQTYKLKNIRPFAKDSSKYDFYPHSPDGRKILYAGGKPETLYMMVKGKPETRRVIDSFERILGYQWSPKGDKILYSIKIANIQGLYWYYIALNTKKLLASGSTIFGDCLWDSAGTIRLHMAGKETVTRYFDIDGNQVSKASIPYVRYRRDSTGRFFRVNDDGTDKAYIDDESYGMFTVSPDRKKAAVTQGGICSILDIYSKNKTNLIDNVGNATWSPDGRMLLFVRYLENPLNPEYDNMGTDIYISNSDGSRITRLTYKPAAFYDNPAFSNDARKVSFYSGKDKRVYMADLVIRE